MTRAGRAAATWVRASIVCVLAGALLVIERLDRIARPTARPTQHFQRRLVGGREGEQKRNI